MREYGISFTTLKPVVYCHYGDIPIDTDADKMSGNVCVTYNILLNKCYGFKEYKISYI